MNGVIHTTGKRASESQQTTARIMQNTTPTYDSGQIDSSDSKSSQIKPPRLSSWTTSPIMKLPSQNFRNTAFSSSFEGDCSIGRSSDGTSRMISKEKQDILDVAITAGFCFRNGFRPIYVGKMLINIFVALG
jgi:hypothetical protein